MRTLRPFLETERLTRRMYKRLCRSGGGVFVRPNHSDDESKPPMHKTATYLGIATAILAFLASSASAATLPGHSVGKHGSSTGQFALTAAQADIDHPKRVWVHATGRLDGIDILVSCSRGFRASSHSIERLHAGLYRVPTMPRAHTCSVVVSGSGSGRIALEVRSA